MTHYQYLVLSVSDLISDLEASCIDLMQSPRRLKVSAGCFLSYT